MSAKKKKVTNPCLLQLRNRLALGERALEVEAKIKFLSQP